MERSVAASSVIWTFWILGFFISGCVANGNKWQHPKKDTSITCYECSSEYDPRCGDPFDPYTIGFVNCSMKPPLEHMKSAAPILCRKTVQKVQGRVRVIRGCGYVSSKNDDKECIKRTGTHDVHVTYCSCTSNLCNTGHFITRPSLSVLITTTIAATATILSSVSA